MLHPTKYTRRYTFWCCYGNMLGFSHLPLQTEILPFATQHVQGKIIVRFSEQKMSAQKYPSTFPRQMEAIVYPLFIRSHNGLLYLFKIFPCFWLVKTTQIIHHNQLLLTKFGKNAKRFVILNQWRQNDVKSAAHCRLLNNWPRKPGEEVVLFLVSRKTKREIAKLL